MEVGLGVGLASGQGPLAVWDFTESVPLGASFARESAATFETAAGGVSLAAAGGPRFVSAGGRRGLLLEPAAACVMPDRGFEGATLGPLGAGGVLPSGVSLYGDSGLVHVVGQGLIGALPYIDLRIVGTPTLPVLAVFLAGVGAVATEIGVAFTQSLWVQHLSGSLAGLDSAIFRTIQTDALGVQKGDQIDSVISLTASLARKVMSSTATAGSHHRPTFLLNLPTMAPVDVTLRLAALNYVKAAIPSSTITTPVTGTAARAADVLTLTAPLGPCHVVMTTSTGSYSFANQSFDAGWIPPVAAPYVLYQVEAWPAT